MAVARTYFTLTKLAVHEKPEVIKQAISRIKLFCPAPEMRIVLYSSNREVPSDARIAAVVQQTNENELAEVISKLLCSEAI